MDDGKNSMICRCSDITEQEVIEAIEAGFTDLELLRRYLHLGMGSCQGRVCIGLVQRILAQKTGKSIAEVGFPTTRPPVSSLPFKVVACEEGRVD